MSHARTVQVGEEVGGRGVGWGDNSYSWLHSVNALRIHFLSSELDFSPLQGSPSIFKDFSNKLAPIYTLLLDRGGC